MHFLSQKVDFGAKRCKMSKMGPKSINKRQGKAWYGQGVTEIIQNDFFLLKKHFLGPKVAKCTILRKFHFFAARRSGYTLATVNSGATVENQTYVKM